MFTCRHVGQSNCPLRIPMGRGYVAPSIHRPTTSKTLNTIWAVSGYVLLHIIVLIVHFSILVDILSSSGSVEILDGTIDRRLDDFLLQFRV